MSEFKECTACNGRGEVGNVLDVDICQFCKGSGVELETLDHEENHISPNCKVGMFEMDKCREAFERFECEKYEANYDDMKKNWDWYESQFGYRYSPDSLRGKDWAVWQKAWQHQQAKVEELKASHHGEVIGHEVHLKKIKQERDELQTLYTQQGINMFKLQKRVDAVIIEIENMYLSGAIGFDTVKKLEQALKVEK